jgi:hypothetical protein
MTKPTINPTDPVFISYRQSDGTDITAELAWLLRAAGIPVWRDRDDLPPGDTEERLGQAIADGLSGGVLVVTPEVDQSEIVRHVEAPRLLELHREHPPFALGITNAIKDPAGSLDYKTPDRLLSQRPGTLSGVDQQSADRNGLVALVKKILWHRIAHQRSAIAASGSTMTLTIQTRNAPQVYDRTGSDLDIRLRPSSHERLPSSQGLRDLADVIALLPDAVTRSGADRVHIKGGAHLSAAFTLGASLPSTRVGHLEVVDQQGQVWAGASAAAARRADHLAAHAERANPSTIRAGRPAVALYIDLLPQRSDAAFEVFLEEHGASLAAWRHVTSTTSAPLNPTTAGALASEAADHIREVSNRHANAEVHLLLRCPFPMAVLIGRLTNTLRIVTYEWDDSAPSTGNDYRPRYVPALRVRTSATSGVIQEVLL